MANSRVNLCFVIGVVVVSALAVVGIVTNTLLDAAIFIGAVGAVFALFFLVAQIPASRRALAERESSPNTPKRWWRRIVGLGGIAAGPVYGYAFPLAAIPACAAIFTKPLAGWPKWSKVLVLWSVMGFVALVLSAKLQGTEVSGNILHYAALALFVTAGVKLTTGLTTTAQLIGWSAISSALFYVIFRPTNTDTFEHLWKYGIGPYIAIAVVWLLCWLSERRTLPIVALVALGVTSVFLGFRSHGLVCFIVVVIMLTQGEALTTSVKVLRRLIAAGVLFGLYKALPAAIEAGLFGATVQERTIAQLSDSGPALLAGRVEPPLSIAAVWERPWFGWGNLDTIGNHTISVGADIAYSLGMVPEDYMRLWVRSDGQISVHSLLGEGWAEGGVLAAIMPLMLLCLFVAAMLRASGSWAPLVVLVSVQGIWDVLFSTWGYNRAFTLALSALLAIWAISKSTQDALEIAQVKLDNGRVVHQPQAG